MRKRSMHLRRTIEFPNYPLVKYTSSNVKKLTLRLTRTGTYSVDVSLIEKDEEDDVVPEASKSIHGRHFDDESKDVVDEGIEGFVGQHSPGQVSHRLQFVVDEQLRCHHDEALKKKF